MFRPVLLAPGFVFLMGGVAQAALTADQVWTAWKDAGALVMLEVSAATEVRDGASLVLNGVSLRPVVEGDAGLAAATMETLTLTEETDGSVTIRPSAALDYKVVTDANDVALRVAQTGMVLTVSETAGGGLSYAVAADLFSIDFDGAFEGYYANDGIEPEDRTVSFRAGLTDLSGTVTDAPGANRQMTMDLAASSVTYAVDNSDPGLGVKSVQNSNTADVTLGIDMTFPATVALSALTTPQAWGTALSEGMAVALRTSQGASSGQSKDENAFLPMDIAFAGLPGEAQIAFSRDGFRMTSSGEGASMSLVSPLLPFPSLELVFGPLVANMAMPVMAADEPGDFGLTLRLSDVVVNEEAWAMLDPGAVLPRGPAQIVIDTKGTAKIDFLEMAAAEQGGMTEVTPPELLTLDVPELMVSVAGAMIAGSGAFTFDNSTGQPVPAGSADVTLTGGNGLIDALVAIGLVPESDAMGARMMMGMFMAPGEGEDVLTSKVEAGADGSIFVNGQQVQ